MAVTPVQRIAKATTGAQASVSIGSGDGWTTPTAGQLIVVAASSDSTCTVNNSMTAGPSVVDDNAAYIWWKIAAGTESTVTVTPGSSADTAIVAAVYAGVMASPLDASNSSTITGSAGTTTTAAAVTTTAAGDLLVAVACLGRMVNNTDSYPTSLTWSNSVTAQVSANSGTASAALPRQYINLGDLLATGAAGSYSTAASWTNTMMNRQHLIMAFKASPSGLPEHPSVVRQAVSRAANW